MISNSIGWGFTARARGSTEKSGFAARYDKYFKNAKSYADWRFKVEEDANAPPPKQCKALH